MTRKQRQIAVNVLRSEARASRDDAARHRDWKEHGQCFRGSEAYAYHRDQQQVHSKQSRALFAAAKAPREGGGPWLT